MTLNRVMGATRHQSCKNQRHRRHVPLAGRHSSGQMIGFCNGENAITAAQGGVICSTPLLLASDDKASESE